MSRRRRFTRALGRLKTIDHRHFDRAFVLALLLFVGVILVTTRNYSARGQLFPLVIGVPTFVLLVALLVILFSERARALVSEYTVTELIDKDALAETGAGGDSRRGDGKSLAEARADVLRISLWIGALFGVVYLFGLLAGSLVFLLVYYRVSARLSLPRVLAYSIVVWLFVVVIFRVLLGAPLYTGVFGVELPFV